MHQTTKTTKTWGQIKQPSAYTAQHNTAQHNTKQNIQHTRTDIGCDVDGFGGVGRADGGRGNDRGMELRVYK